MAKKAKAAKTPKLTEKRVALLRDLVTRIEEFEGANIIDAMGMITRLIGEHGAEIDDDQPTVRVTMAGISATGSRGLGHALRNWANAARRELLKAD